MFESLTQSLTPDDDRWRLLRKVFFLVPPAFSALCLGLYTAGRLIASRPLTESIALVWVLGMIAFPIVLAVLCALTGRWRWAFGALAYGSALAVATFAVAIFVGVATVH